MSMMGELAKFSEVASIARPSDGGGESMKAPSMGAGDFNILKALTSNPFNAAKMVASVFDGKNPFSIEG